jgi:SpoIIAA-like
MPISMQHEGDNVYRVELAGTLQQRDFNRCQEEVVREIERIGPVRLLFVLRQFDGWERSGGWNDLSFYISHGDLIERIAIVGPARWRDESMMFAAADLRRAPVEFFPESALADARAWLAS